MCKTKHNSKYCKWYLFVVSKIEIIWSSRTTPDFINYQIWTSYKTFLSLKSLFSYQWLIAVFTRVLLRVTACYYHVTYAFQRESSTLKSCLNVNPFRIGGVIKTLPTSFPPVTSTNVGFSPQNFLTFSFNPFATLV